MSLSAALATLAEPLLQLPATVAVDNLGETMANRRAFSAAREALRSKYSAAVAPASYDFVIENFRLEKVDFLDYFRSTSTPSLGGLREHLLSRLQIRSDGWTSNRPKDALLKDLVDDFYEVYLRYFIVSDPTLASLQVTGATHDLLKGLQEIRVSLDRLRRSMPDMSLLVPETQLPLLVYLAVLELSYQILHTSDDSVDVRILDTGGLFPQAAFCCALLERPTDPDISAMADRLSEYGQFSRHYIVVPGPPEPDLELAIGHVRAQLVTYGSLEARLSHVASQTIYRAGSIAAEHFQRSLSVSTSFVDPDCVPVSPGSTMETAWLAPRRSALLSSREFVEDPSKRILLLLGSYGSGKTTLCSELLVRYSQPDSSHAAVLVSLKDVAPNFDLPAIVRRAAALARSSTRSAKPTLVILDGLDELPNAMSRSEKRQNLIRIMHSASQCDKLLITSRSSYFRGVEDLWSLFPRAEDSPFWAVLTRSATPLGSRPEMSAALLLDFTSEKLIDYATQRLGPGAEPSAVESFMAALETADKYGTLRQMMRWPLFMALLLESRPWEHRTAGSVAAVMRDLLKYWLERDQLKGPSRWLLSTAERYSFLSHLAWEMYTSGARVITFERFEQICRDFFAPRSAALDDVVLDLQTTGCLAAYGDTVFMIGPFFDYLTANVLIGATFSSVPRQAPNAAQGRMMLGLSEERQLDFGYWAGHSCDELLAGIGVRYGECSENLSIPFEGILFQPPRTGTWKANEASLIRLRVAINYALRIAPSHDPSVIRMAFLNRLGLHARTAARIVHATAKWIESTDPGATVVFRSQGIDTAATNILGLLLLAIPHGSVVEVLVSPGGPEGVSSYMNLLKCSRAVPDAPFDWVYREEIS